MAEGEKTALADRLRRHVHALSCEIGDRNYSRYDELNLAADYIHSQLEACGYSPKRHGYSVEGKEFFNIVAEKRGLYAPRKIVVLGAHYDTCFNPGADDNASAVAGMIEIAFSLSGSGLARTVRFAAFVNEEPPFFKTEFMGSLIYAKSAREMGDEIEGALILESIGYYSDEPGSQSYPPLFLRSYPDRGNFIGVVGNFASRRLVKRVVAAFMNCSRFPIESVISTGLIPGVDWSDNWSFWKVGYPAVMITDTAFFRNPNYHKASDTCETLDYERMAEVVIGLRGAIANLAS